MTVTERCFLLREYITHSLTHALSLEVGHFGSLTHQFSAHGHSLTLRGPHRESVLHTPTHSGRLTHSLSHSLTLTHSLTQSSVPQPAHSLTHSVTHSLSFIHSLSLTVFHSLSLTHSLSLFALSLSSSARTLLHCCTEEGRKEGRKPVVFEVFGGFGVFAVLLFLQFLQFSLFHRILRNSTGVFKRRGCGLWAAVGGCE